MLSCGAGERWPLAAPGVALPGVSTRRVSRRFRPKPPFPSSSSPVQKGRPTGAAQRQAARHADKSRSKQQRLDSQLSSGLAAAPAQQAHLPAHHLRPGPDLGQHRPAGPAPPAPQSAPQAGLPAGRCRQNAKHGILSCGRRQKWPAHGSVQLSAADTLTRGSQTCRQARQQEGNHAERQDRGSNGLAGWLACAWMIPIWALTVL